LHQNFCCNINDLPDIPISRCVTIIRIRPQTDRDTDRDRIMQPATAIPITSHVRRSAPKALTIAAINALKAGKMAADGAVRPGHGSLKARRRKTATGSVVEFIYVYQHSGRTSTLTVGRFSPTETEGAVTLVQARTEAARLQAIVKAGEDPKSKREHARLDAKIKQATHTAQLREAEKSTLAALCDEYVANLRSKGKTASAYDVENLVKNHVKAAFPHLAELPAAAITPTHIAHILARLVGPAAKSEDQREVAGKRLKKGRTALKLRSYLSTAFRYGLGAAVDPTAATGAATFGLTMNPVASVPSTNMARQFNRAGTRALSISEFREYLLHVNALPSTLTRLALTLQVLSGGQRLQQMLRLDTADIQPGATLTLYDPKGRRAQARAHVLPILPEIQDVLNELAAINAAGPIFGSGESVLRPETLSTAVKEIGDSMVSAGTAVASFRGGDIRRTIETLLAERLNVSKDVRAQLLSHGLSGVQDRNYDKGLHLAQKTSALRRWNDFIADLAIGNPVTSNVHQLHAA
jgi:integrase